MKTIIVSYKKIITNCDKCKKKFNDFELIFTNDVENYYCTYCFYILFPKSVPKYRLKKEEWKEVDDIIVSVPIK